jgi:ATP-dependent DNA helicase RecG
MLSDDVRRHVERPEGQFFDRKSARIQPRDLARHVIAFANADGGTIALGIEDDKLITGIEQYADALNRLIQVGIDFCSPPIRVTHELLPCINAAGEPDHVLILTVPQSDRVHTRTDDKVFLRVGDQSRELSFQERIELQYDKGETNYEAVVPPDATMADIDLTLLEEYRLTIGMRGAAEAVLSARGLARRRNDDLSINYAGILLFGTDPTRWLPRAEVRVLRYEGVRPETGPRMNVVKDVTIDGPLPRLLPEALRAVDTQLRSFTRLASDGLFRTTPEYPAFAWQEAVTNALIHRSYSLSGMRIEVHIFDDRLEVVSPGRLPGIVRVHNLREVHFSRNPRVTRVLSDLGFVRDVGEGVDRMYEEMASAHLPPPEFREHEYTFQVTLRKTLAAREAEPVPIGGPTRQVVHVPGNVARALNHRQMAALRFLLTHDRITTTDLVRMFPGISDRTASTDLNGLVSLKLLHRVGRTRGTYYHAGGMAFRLPNEV